MHRVECLIFHLLSPLLGGDQFRSEDRSSKWASMETKFKRCQFIIEILSDRKLKPLSLGGVTMGTGDGPGDGTSPSFIG